MSRADAAIAAGDLEDAAPLLVRIEEVFEGVHPFGVRNRPDGWQTLLADWIAGESVVRADSEAGDFVRHTARSGDAVD